MTDNKQDFLGVFIDGVQEQAKGEFDKHVSEALEIFDATLEKKVEDLSKFVVKPIVVKQGKKIVTKLEELTHKRFESLANVAQARSTKGSRLNIWMSGPAGGGKSHAAKQLAKLMNTPFTFHGSMSMPHELVGFVDGYGKYHTTPFVESFRNGGVCLLDELDAGSNEALLALNAPLANDLMSLPNGEIIERHEDFICIGAANTWGFGSTDNYVGRTRIDAAFLDRFPAKINWDYDEELEEKLCTNKNWFKQVKRVRDKANDKGLKVVISPRITYAGDALITNGLPIKTVAELTYKANLTPEQVKMVC